MKFYGYRTSQGGTHFPFGSGMEDTPPYWVVAKGDKVYTVEIGSKKIKPLLGYTPDMCDEYVARKAWTEVIPAGDLAKLFD
jgi:hypothetical protein